MFNKVKQGRDVCIFTNFMVGCFYKSNGDLMCFRSCVHQDTHSYLNKIILKHREKGPEIKDYMSRRQVGKHLLLDEESIRTIKRIRDLARKSQIVHTV